ncbi:MAG TPA: hypothetical protein EYN66_09460 [Myxococcales bacterium]|nr:hypothetical protein [Myxococcales bacterium]
MTCKTRVQWQGELPAGSAIDTQYLIGAIPVDKILRITACSYYGGDAGERYLVNAVPAGIVVEGTTFDATNGSVNLIYPLGGGTYAVEHPVNSLTENLGISPMLIAGPCSLSVSCQAESSAALHVTILGILEDM